MNCRAILRKSPNAGCQCPWQATRDGWCKVHDPLIVVPRLVAKRDRLAAALAKVDEAIDSYKPADPIENAS